MDTTEQSVLVDLVPQANLAGLAKVTPLSKATLPFPADLVDTTEQSVLVDLAPQANLAGLAKVTPMSKATLAVSVRQAGLGAAKVRANRPSAAKTRICLSASKGIRRHADDETGIANYVRTQNAANLCRLLGSLIAPARGRPCAVR